MHRPANAAPLPGGGYAVTWVVATGDSTTERVQAQVFGADGIAIGAAFAVAPGQDTWQRSPTIAHLADGGFVVGWAAIDTGVDQVFAQRFDATGHAVGSAIPIASDAASFSFPASLVDLVALPGGGFLATWNHGGTSPGEVMARRYGADGAPLGAAFQVNTYTTDYQGGAEAAAFADGSFVVVWNSTGQDGDGSGIYGQRFSAAGASVGSEFRVNTVTSGGQSDPTVTALADGGFVVTWSQPSIFAPTVVRAQVYNAAGVAVGGEITVDSFNTAQPSPDPVVAALPDGGFVIAWEKSYDDIRAQRYTANGTPIGAVFDVSTTAPDDISASRGMQDMIVTEGGELIVFWSFGHNPNPNDADILAQRYQVANFATEQVALPLAGAITVGDDGIASNVVTVTLSVDFGLLTVNTTGSGVGASGNGTASVTLTGTVAQLNALLAGGTGSAVSFLANSDTPPDEATLTVHVTDAENQSTSTSISIAIAAVADVPVAQPDAATTTEAASKSGNLFADNGSGADSDPDGPALTVFAVNGSSAAVGTTITLASGALLTVQANGNYLYNPNGKFNSLPGAGSGASNISTHDSFTYTLTGGGTATVTLTVTGLDSEDTLLGTPGNDTLIGGGGADTMQGLGGDDRYYVDNAADRVLEASGGGNDILLTSVTYTLAAGSQVESLATTNVSGTDAINITGNEFANTIVGNAGNNQLIGGGGADTMQGLGGDDRYYVDNAADRVLEASGGGNDILLTSVTYTLAAGSQVESLATTNVSGTDAINITGNEFANTIVGNAGNNQLVGGGGADTMQGLGGDDRYYVDNAADRVLEASGGGNDILLTSVDYLLAPGTFVENLSTGNQAGTDAIDITGNEIDNVIVGNQGANILDGGAGADKLQGLGGDDRYYVDNAGDLLFEAVGGGNDIVLTSVDYALSPSAEVESLTTYNQAGFEGIDIIANDFANVVVGNAGANILRGAGGNDVIQGLAGADYLYGGTGNDRLFGGAGADLYVFNTALNAATNVDRLEDYSVADDSIVLDRDFFGGILTNGWLDAAAFRTGAAAADADDRIVYNSATGQIFYDADGSGAAAQILFATVTAGTALTNLEFSAMA